MQIKTMMKYHYTPIRKFEIKKKKWLTTSGISEDIKQLELSHLLMGGI